MFLVCHVMFVMFLVYGWYSFMVSHTPIKFGDDRHRGSGDVLVFVCHMISEHLVTKRSRNIGRNPSRLVTILPSLVVIGTGVVKIWF